MLPKARPTPAISCASSAASGAFSAPHSLKVVQQSAFLTLKRAFVGICLGAPRPGRNFGRSNNGSNRSRAFYAGCSLSSTAYCRTPKLAQAKLKVQAGTVPSKRGAGKENTMKTSMLIKIVASLAIGAAFPLGAIAAQPAKTTTERGVIQKAETPGQGAEKALFAHDWMES